MKSYLLLCTIALFSHWAFSQSSPAQRVQQAYTSQDLNAMTNEQRVALEFRAEKLCWFEELKSQAETSWFALTDKSGNSVTFTDEMVNDFNPLLYNLPQQANRCENLPIQTTSGRNYLLIVRSEEMMQKEWERRVIKNAKTNAK
jgi:hypothetical protein